MLADPARQAAAGSSFQSPSAGCQALQAPLLKLLRQRPPSAPCAKRLIVPVPQEAAAGPEIRMPPTSDSPGMPAGAVEAGRCQMALVSSAHEDAQPAGARGDRAGVILRARPRAIPSGAARPSRSSEVP